MTDPARTPESAPEAPDVAETVRFLRRFADMMSNGQNAAYLLNAAVLLETLAARVIVSSDEEQLWRHRSESLTEDNDRLEAECDSLKHDLEGHLDLSRSLLGERDTLATTLEARDAQLGELNETLKGEREQFAAKSQAHDQTLAELRRGFDQEREALKAIMAARDEELGQVRETLRSEREQFTQKLEAREIALAELQISSERERDELRARIASREEQLAALRGEAERDSEWLKSRIATLEAKRVELRSALDRLGHLEIPAAASNGALEAETRASANPGTDPANPEGSAVVPLATLRHARAQFEYLARECLSRGDVATQVMCELGAYTLQLALKEGDRADPPPAGKIALSILEPDQASSVVADNA